jgi:hypothetical protein
LGYTGGELDHLTMELSLALSLTLLVLLLRLRLPMFARLWFALALLGATKLGSELVVSSRLKSGSDPEEEWRGLNACSG